MGVGGNGGKSRLCPAPGGFLWNVTGWEVVMNPPQPTSHGRLGASPLCPEPTPAVGGQVQLLLPPSRPFLPFQRRFRISPQCTPPSGAPRISERMLPRSTQGCWDLHPATLRPPSPAQSGPTSLEPRATPFWGVLTPEQQQAMRTHTSKRAPPLPDTAPGQRMARRRRRRRGRTPGVPPAPHLRTRTRRRRVSFSGSPSPSPG